MRLNRAAPPLLAVLLWACSALPPGADGGEGGDGGGGTSDGGGGRDAGVDAGVPEKILFVFEQTPSLSVTDPNATRAVAFRQFLDALPNDPRISISAQAFEGTTRVALNGQFLDFVPMTQVTAADRADMVSRLTTFRAPGGDGGAQFRDWVFALDGIYSILYRDTMRVLTFGEPQARYSIIFVSDGAPTNNQDDQLLCGDAVTRIRGLASIALDVRFHTVHVFLPNQPVSTTCTEDAGIVGGSACALPELTNPVCPLLKVDLDAERLRRMAALGGGRSFDFRSSAVDFSFLVTP